MPTITYTEREYNELWEQLDAQKSLAQAFEAQYDRAVKTIYAQQKEHERLTSLVTEMKEDAEGMRRSRGSLINDLLYTQERLNDVEATLDYLLEVHDTVYKSHFGRSPEGNSFISDQAHAVLRGAAVHDAIRNSHRYVTDSPTSERDGRPSDSDDSYRDSPLPHSAGVLREAGNLSGCGADADRQPGRLANAA